MDNKSEYHLREQYPQHDGLDSPWYRICSTIWLNRYTYDIEKLNKMISPEKQIRFINNILYRIKEIQSGLEYMINEYNRLSSVNQTTIGMMKIKYIGGIRDVNL